MRLLKIATFSFFLSLLCGIPLNFNFGAGLTFTFPSHAQVPTRIRVKVLDDVSTLLLKITGDYQVQDAYNQTVVCQGKGLNVTVTAGKEGVVLGKMKCGAAKLFVKSWNPDEIIINGRRFRGDIRVAKNEKKNLVVINEVELEDYIKGVLYHEASHYWPDEILKAQAIVCRTYALYQMREGNRSDFDVTSDTYSQMYGGSTSERYRTNKVAEETRGRILTYQGMIFPAYFHATCAGHTEDASRLWKIDIGPLHGVVCDFCKGSPHYQWHAAIPQDDFRWSLRKAGYRLKKLKAIEIVDKDESGRITELKLFDSDKDITITAKDLRSIIGSNIIRSTNFKVSLAADEVLFEGLGWGHGVGMCQWGGYFMAKSGYDHGKILQYYYPGSQISSIERVP